MREHSGNIWGTFRKHSGNIQEIFREYSDDDSKPVWPTWAVAN
jgi:hypothetical protein